MYERDTPALGGTWEEERRWRGPCVTYLIFHYGLEVAADLLLLTSHQLLLLLLRELLVLVPETVGALHDGLQHLTAAVAPQQQDKIDHGLRAKGI